MLICYFYEIYVFLVPSFVRLENGQLSANQQFIITNNSYNKQLILPKNSENQLIVSRDDKNQLIAQRNNLNQIVVSYQTQNSSFVPQNNQIDINAPHDIKNQLIISHNNHNLGVANDVDEAFESNSDEMMSEDEIKEEIDDETENNDQSYPGSIFFFSDTCFTKL